MQLPNFLSDPGLNSLREQMGAVDLGSFRLAFNVYRFTISDLEQSVAGGIVVDDLSKVRTLDDKTLSYKDRRVLLHLRDVHPPMGDIAGSTSRLPSFHACNCVEVRRIRGLDLPPEVVLVAREDGEFTIRTIDGGNVAESVWPLPACVECLRELQMAEFHIAAFFQRYGRNVSDADTRAVPSPV